MCVEGRGGCLSSPGSRRWGRGGLARLRALPPPPPNHAAGTVSRVACLQMSAPASPSLICPGCQVHLRASIALTQAEVIKLESLEKIAECMHTTRQRTVERRLDAEGPKPNEKADSKIEEVAGTVRILRRMLQGRGEMQETCRGEGLYSSGSPCTRSSGKDAVLALHLYATHPCLLPPAPGAGQRGA